MLILGINGGVRLGYQDISAVLVRDGRVIAAVEEERLNRIKNSPGQLPEQSILEVLKIAGVTIQDVDLVATHGETWGEVYEETLKGYFQFRFGHAPPIRRYHHHLCHAASAYYGSGFENSMILTLDSSGDGISTLLAVGKKGELTVERMEERPNSLGMFYTALTQYCGFVRDRDEYKLMGLASYGQRGQIDLSWLLKWEKDFYQLNTDVLKKVEPGAPQPTRQQACYGSVLEERLGPARRKEQPITDHYKNVAAGTQQLLEEQAIRLVKNLQNKTGLKNLCLAGGVALNCVMNQRLAELDVIEGLYVQPAAGDAGVSLGAAYLGALELGDCPEPMDHAFLGSRFADDEIKAYLDLCGLKYLEVSDVGKEASDRILRGEVIGWHQGPAEFGPRALGARSILADPGRAEMKDLVNRKVKFRESFRPFCPSVLAEDSRQHFSLGTREGVLSPYMTVTFDVKTESQSKLPAITHVDQTARIQTVGQVENPIYRRLLESLKEASGIGVVLNTSFNLSREPIANSPQDAVASFFACGLDSLFLGSFLITKKA
ncbi:MAG: carbamoyl transferase [Bdellovibrionaceae bacterium]|nr:hypothetical protein [Bdellovibrionales bacterium]MCB9083095.1 carbamoyl transferase [Pseudobdellovibrionaceae bacterium]